jgi:hypothetical protein
VACFTASATKRVSAFGAFFCRPRRGEQPAELAWLRAPKGRVRHLVFAALTLMAVSRGSTMPPLSTFCDHDTGQPHETCVVSDAT